MRAVLLWLVVGLGVVAGCALTTARQSVGTPPGSPATQPAGPGPAGDAPQVSQQSGQGNLAAQLDSSGWKAIEYNTAVPVGQVALLGLLVVLSHRREMARIKGVKREAPTAVKRER